jgi:murein DD-endopeptidase MepM/ murein hydrolase activator NlpD
MKFLLGLTLIGILPACAQTPAPVTAVAEEVNQKIRPGEVRWLELNLPEEGKPRLLCRGQEVRMARKGNKGHAVIVESYFSELQPFKCQLQVDNATVTNLNFKVEDKEYLAEQLSVDPKKIVPPKKDLARIEKEQKMLNKIFASSGDKLLFEKPFMGPMQSLVTSVYGVKRVYNKQKKGQHLGIDYRAAIGDKVPSANRGKVVFAGDLFYTGGTVIIDHGLDIFTVYGHLSKPLVKAGSMVEKGDIIALSGNTGRTSGPHLHWGVKIQGEYIDGFVLVDETQKYFE